jgi:dTDP-4-amino-4,6-dideoxygalactose transaminase
MGGEEMNFIKEAFDANWIAPHGPAVDGFEEDVRHFVGSNFHVAALSSGTAALHLALILCGVQAGDEVICQSMTFSASANPIVYLGAKPVFVDSEPQTWNICPDTLRNAIRGRMEKGNKPKAIIVVHLYGMPAKMQDLQLIAAEFDIPLIEDAAEALGSAWNDRRCGTFGKFSILSFNGNKIITTSGGGALISREVAAINQARFLSTQARDPAPHYEHSVVGYNYRLSNICASIGRGQMKILPERIVQRRKNFSLYREALSRFPGISFLEEPEGHYSNRWLTTITVDPEQSGGITNNILRERMDVENIESRLLWKPMHLQPVFSGSSYYGNGVSERLFMRGLCLPSGSNLSENDMLRIIEVFEKLFA